MHALPTWLEINLDALVENVRTIRSEIADGVRVLLTVKADAYGHGAVQVAAAAQNRVDRFGVATIDEALELSAAGIRKSILILSPILEAEIPTVVDNGFLSTVSSLAFARRISDYGASVQQRAEVHVEVDTGMGRTGVLPDDAEDLIGKLSRLPGIRLGGLFTHFPMSDSDAAFTRSQVESFQALIGRLARRGIDIPTLHAANSGAIHKVQESHLEMVRPGLLAYGHFPGLARRTLDVSPVMSWKSRIVQIREVPEGTRISYGGDFTTRRSTTMGVLPVGYGHGYPFRLSNCGCVIAGGRRVPILGRVTMDMTMVDLTDIEPRPEVGDEITLMGKQGDAEITVDHIADWAGTISYEVLTGVSKRVPRIYFRNGEVETFKSLLGVIPNNVGV